MNSMLIETKQCQNCEQEFTIEPDDFNFYRKIDVPPNIMFEKSAHQVEVI